jgi:hypothetical protein
VAAGQEAWVDQVVTRSLHELMQAMGLSGISKSTVRELCNNVGERARPNRASIMRILGAVLFEQNNEWQTSSRDMRIETLVRMDKEGTNHILGITTKPPAHDLRQFGKLHHLDGRDLQFPPKPHGAIAALKTFPNQLAEGKTERLRVKSYVFEYQNAGKYLSRDSLDKSR